MTTVFKPEDEQQKCAAQSWPSVLARSPPVLFESAVGGDLDDAMDSNGNMTVDFGFFSGMSPG